MKSDYKTIGFISVAFKQTDSSFIVIYMQNILTVLFKENEGK